ncbi:MAG: hypothetical protein ABI761_13010 [Saprospiraceae bacterium]
MKKLVYGFFIMMIIFACASKKVISDNQKDISKEDVESKPVRTSIITGALNVIDYQDTFKTRFGASLVDSVINAKLQDSIIITILLEGTEKGKKITLHQGEQFNDLFKNKTLTQYEGWVNPSKDFSKAFKNSKGYKVIIDRIHKNGKETFYGILEFNKIYEKCSGDPSARSYFIRIPDLYLNNARGGNLSVVYEYYECAPREGDKTVRDYTTKKSRYTSWVLWISDITFE